MAHIVTCMVNSNGEHGSLKNYISRQQPSTDSVIASYSWSFTRPSRTLSLTTLFFCTARIVYSFYR